jgi:hypothetical protein
MTAFNGGPQRGPLTKNVLLPHKLIEAPRPHPHGQGRISSYLRGLGCFTRVEQSVVHL